jgi:hypothetical protein
VLGNEAVRTLTHTVTLDERGTTPEDLVNGAAVDAWLTATVSDYVHACGS